MNNMPQLAPVVHIHTNEQSIYRSSEGNAVDYVPYWETALCETPGRVRPLVLMQTQSNPLMYISHKL